MRKRYAAGRKRRQLKGGVQQGQGDGFREGWAQGYRKGRCEAVVRHVSAGAGPAWDLRVLYVKEGFASLDQGIMQALSQLVQEVVPAAQNQNIAELAAQVRPDLVLVLNGTRLPVQQIDAIRAQGIKTAVWIVDDPYHTDLSQQSAAHYDFVFTHELSCVPFYQGFGCAQVHYLPLAAPPQLFYPKAVGPEYVSDICFIGNAFPHRLAFFNQIARFLAGRRVVIAGLWWNRMRRFPLLRGKIRRAWLSPEQTANYYNGAKIVINLHRSHADTAHNSGRLPALSVNPRTYEIAACGSFQLTDVRDDLAQLYVPGQEIAIYSSPKELMDKIVHYLHHEPERQEIAVRGYERTIREHTYRDRLTHMLGLLFPE